ncbi:MAG: hypothetical protein RAK18_05200 [Conexivisphaerales archaeon]|jgi:alanyl-tRNA synthetase|nr:hypothetical protein [Conexivisphaerales archaeon]
MVDPRAAAHTAEHVFMRALTKRVKVFPVLVEQDEWQGKIVLEGDEPAWSSISEALAEANSIMMEGRRVVEHVFDSMEDARRTFPELRAYEERITPPVRVVEVEGYDWAACARRHVQNTLEAWGIVISDLHSLSRGRYELRFSAGPAAAMTYSIIVREAGLSAKALNVKLDALSMRVLELISRLDALRAAQRSISRALLRGPATLRTRSGAELRVIESRGLEFKGILEDSVEMATRSGAFLLLISPGSPGEQTQVLLAVPRGSGMNAGALLKEALSAVGGRGGGGPEAATGSLEEPAIPRLMDVLSSKL